jgi:hypothetical protein
MHVSVADIAVRYMLDLMDTLSEHAEECLLINVGENMTGEVLWWKLFSCQSKHIT